LTHYNTPILRLEQVAAWWLPESLKGQLHPSVRAALPSLQRNFVWDTNQIESLWDSIAQGFPIGSLLLSLVPENKNEDAPFKSRAIIAKGHGSEGNIESPTHFLLDGQQRTTSIALGFRNIWTNSNENDAKQALWVDLSPLENDDRAFLFRVVTKAHPWGFSKTRSGNTSKRLSAAQARDAMKEFRKSSGNAIKPHELDIKNVFPWDTKAPIPVPLLIAAIKEHDGNIEEVAKHLWEKLNANTCWTSLLSNKGEYIQGYLSPPSESFRQLVTGLQKALKNTEIPALILTEHISRNDSNENIDGETDANQPIYNLFKRINTGGTTLDREDINYSMLKSIWPEARKVIEDKLLGKCRLAKPARMVAIMTRLVLMKRNDYKGGLQAELPIAQFKNEINKGMKDEIEKYCQDRGQEVLDNVWNILTEGKHALPIVLASQISHQADDLFLLLMYWVDSLPKNSFDSIEKNKVLGFITAIAWFSPDQKNCAILLGKELVELKKHEDIEGIKNFFDKEQFAKILQLTDKRKILMPPLPTPDMLNKILLLPLSPLNKNEDGLWTKKDLWDHYGGEKTPEEVIDFSGKHMAILESDGNQKIKDAWWHFLHRTCKSADHTILLYAQRKCINKWFNWFDPTQPDQIIGHNRPWDYDHILPHSWTNHESSRMKSEVPHLVRIWVNSNGNFRAWPLELNRSKRNSKIIEDSIPEYQLEGKGAVCNASFIKNETDWNNLCDQTKEKFCKEGNEEKWICFVEAAIQRNVDIYREWYEELHIGSLMEET